MEVTDPEEMRAHFHKWFDVHLDALFKHPELEYVSIKAYHDGLMIGGCGWNPSALKKV